MPFTDRSEAGRLLGAELREFAGRNDAIVLALPRGGVPVAREIARALAAPLDVFVVRKIGVPARPELAMGAVASGGIYITNRDVVKALNIPDDEFAAILKEESAELRRREVLYRDNRPEPDLTGKTVILVDDGLATGATMLVAIEALRKQRPAKIIAAFPLAPPETQAAVASAADGVVCLINPEPFFSVGSHYQRFEQTTDDEVRRILAECA